jgi:lipopolysaccharide/colanic/teichoic acid biosynthesis glycosyltransferase
MRPDTIPQLHLDRESMPSVSDRLAKGDVSTRRPYENRALSTAPRNGGRPAHKGVNGNGVHYHPSGSYKPPLRSDGRTGPAARRREAEAGLVMALAPAEHSESGVLTGNYPGSWEGSSNGSAAAYGRNGHSQEGAARIAEWAAQIRPETQSFYARFGKRALDIFGALTGIALFGPVMLLFALLIKVTSRGPVFYRSTRLGQDGRHFTFLKFRSMYVGADRDRDQLLHLNEVDGPAFKISRDPRTTRIGRFMRSTSVDELPQFFNVLRGDMSLVGPRPPLPEEEAKYEPWQRRRLEVKPGITCLWQISGRSRLGFNEWMRLDLEYIRRQSFATDARILLRTIPAVVSRDGAY